MKLHPLLILLAVLGTILMPSGGAAAADALAAGFQNPPPSARPWVYWFWLNGNITREGITLDLEAMKRVGIGGVLIMEVDQGVPLGPAAFAGEKWRELFVHVVREAARLGLQVNMNNDAGWCGSGGPWVRPEHAMQKVVWSEMEVTGPTTFSERLPQPPVVAERYRDIATLAFPTPGAYRIPNIERRSAVVRGDYMPDARSPEAPADAVVDRGRIIVLTELLGEDGTLRWTVPAGRWTILRLGHTPTGAMNQPAPLSGRGLEVDKLSATALDAYWDGFMARIIADVGPLAGATLVATHIDSWETGSQNWTPRLREEFTALRGYDPLLYLPVYAGYVVGSSDASDRFLYDLRQTVSDLLSKNYAGRMRELAHRHGMRLTIEAYGDTTVDNMAYAGRCDEPMGEFWATTSFTTDNTVHEMVSAAHVYGRPIVGAEAFTADGNERWLLHPGSIKAQGDWAFAAGVNRIVYHRYALQPWRDRKPGMTMGPYGLHYERTQTWWEQSSAWHRYQSRCQYLLQQGKPVGDILCMAPEGAPRTFVPPVEFYRAGYRADGCPAELILNEAAVVDGRVTLRSGMSYRMLVLPETRAMSLPLLRKIRSLVEAGALVVGAPPMVGPGLLGADDEVALAARAVWKSGRVVSPKSALQALAARGVGPDFRSDRPLEWNHRRIGDADVYFVANTRSGRANALCDFRVTGKAPEIWDPITGEIRPTAYYARMGAITRVLVPLEAAQATFVVFRRAKARVQPVTRITRNGTVVWPIARKPGSLRILRAVWGPLGDESRTKDVTDQVRRMVARVGVRFRVADLAAEGDPAYMVVKTLRVEYVADGLRMQATATDPQMIEFAMPPDPPMPIELIADSSGTVTVVGQTAGAYTIQMGSGRPVRRSMPSSVTAALKGPWSVRFPPNHGAPESLRMERLSGLQTSPVAGVRHFSGSASYTTRFEWRETVGRGRRYVLDLGRVEVMARVRLNGQDLGILWHAPYRMDITEALKKGENRLDVEVTNLWVNRMIGDEELPDDSRRHPDGRLVEWPEWVAGAGPSPTGRYTFTTWRLWRKGEPLQPSGLIGPLTIRSLPTARLR